MDIKVTQYLFPNGEERTLLLEIPDALKEKVESILAMGLSFSCEAPMPGQVVMYISDNENEQDLVVEFAVNGPGENSPQNTLIRMIERFVKMPNAPKEAE